MRSFFSYAASLMLLALSKAEVKTCTEETCLVFVIDSRETAASASQCSTLVPNLSEFPAFATSNFYCGPYLDDVSGFVVTDFTGMYKIFASAVVSECVASIDLYVGTYSDDKLYECITACPYLEAGPSAKAGADSTQATHAVGSIPKKFTASVNTFNGYTPSLPINFGSTGKGQVDVVAAKVPLQMGMKVVFHPFGTGCTTFQFAKLESAPPSLTAAVLLFPSQLVGLDMSLQLLDEFNQMHHWYRINLVSGAKYVFFDPPDFNERYKYWQGAWEDLMDQVERMKSSDFSPLGTLYSKGSLKYLYGVLTEYEMLTSNYQSVVATFNFEVTPFQEAFSYLFFSPLLKMIESHRAETQGDDMHHFVGFALNMLVRRLASTEALCNVHTEFTQAGCARAAALYPTRVSRSYMRSFADFEAARLTYNSATPNPDKPGTFKSLSGLVYRNPPLGGNIRVSQVNVASGAASDATGDFEGNANVQLPDCDDAAHVQGKESVNCNNRRLADIADAALPALRSSTASAQAAPAREDGMSTRRLAQFVQIEQDTSLSRSEYENNAEDYVGCMDEQSTCQKGIDEILELLSSGTIDKPSDSVVFFYHHLDIVLVGCEGGAKVLFPSECPVDMQSKEVSYLFGGSGAPAVDAGPVKTDMYISKGFPAASRLDRMMNFIVQAFVA